MWVKVCSHPKIMTLKYLGEKRCKALHSVSAQVAGSVTRNGNTNSTETSVSIKKP